MAEFIEIEFSGLVLSMINWTDLLYNSFSFRVAKGKRLPEDYRRYLIRKDSPISDKTTFKFPIDKLVDDRIGLEKEELFGFR